MVMEFLPGAEFTVDVLRKDNNMTIFQPGRYNDIMEVRVKQGESKGLTTGFTERIFKSIHEESILHQETLMKEKP